MTQPVPDTFVSSFRGIKPPEAVTKFCAKWNELAGRSGVQARVSARCVGRANPLAPPVLSITLHATMQPRPTSHMLGDLELRTVDAAIKDLCAKAGVFVGFQVEVPPASA